MNISEASKYSVIISFNCFKFKNARFTNVLLNCCCRAQCAFCSVWNFNGHGVGIKSVQVGIDELLITKEKYGIIHIM